MGAALRRSRRHGASAPRARSARSATARASASARAAVAPRRAGRGARAGGDGQARIARIDDEAEAGGLPQQGRRPRTAAMPGIASARPGESAHFAAALAHGSMPRSGRGHPPAQRPKGRARRSAYDPPVDTNPARGAAGRGGGTLPGSRRRPAVRAARTAGGAIAQAARPRRPAPRGEPREDQPAPLPGTSATARVPGQTGASGAARLKATSGRRRASSRRSAPTPSRATRRRRRRLDAGLGGSSGRARQAASMAAARAEASIGLGRIDRPANGRRDHEPERPVAARAVGEARRGEHGRQGRDGVRSRDAADLEVAARRDVDQAVAVARARPRRSRRTCAAVRTPPGGWRRTSSPSPVAIGRSDAGAPAAAAGRRRRGAHSAASRSGHRQSVATELRRLCQSPRRRASASRSTDGAGGGRVGGPDAARRGVEIGDVGAVDRDRGRHRTRHPCVAAKTKSASTACASSAAPRQPWRSCASIQRGWTRRPWTRRAMSSARRARLRGPPAGWCRGCRGPACAPSHARGGREAADRVRRPRPRRGGRARRRR